jgi:cardiolipin synthase
VLSPHPAAAAQPLRFRERQLGSHRARWLASVDEAYAEMARLIGAATRAVRLETYLMREAGPATELRELLLHACARGVKVQILIDAFGSEDLPADFLQPLRVAGAAVAVFNPQRWLRRSFRDHRKLLTCDGEHAVIGGFNIGPEYAGDGVSRGWCDTGLAVSGPIVATLERSFDAMFGLAPFLPGCLRRFRKSVRQPRRARHLADAGTAPAAAVSLLRIGPGLPRGQLARAVRHDLRSAHDVAITSAYFLPSLRLCRLLYRVARGTGRVRLLLAGRTDVPIARLAAERFYGRLMRRRVQILEYQPQVLHAKLLVLDDIVYVGSANLDRRSLRINYELLLRLDWPELAADARQWFETALEQAMAVDWQRWRTARSPWRRLLSYLAYLLLARVDPYVARRGLRAIS